MNLESTNGKDFSKELLTLMGIIVTNIWGMESALYLVARQLDREGYINSFFQLKKKAISQARQDLDKVLSNLETAFANTFDNILGVEGEGIGRSAWMLRNANELFQMMLLFYVKGDGDKDKRARMLKALDNFKQADNGIDLESMMRFFSVRK